MQGHAIPADIRRINNNGLRPSHQQAYNALELQPAGVVLRASDHDASTSKPPGTIEREQSWSWKLTLMQFVKPNCCPETTKISQEPG